MVKLGSTLESSRKDGRLVNSNNIYDKELDMMQVEINQKVSSLSQVDEEDLTKSLDEDGRSVTKIADRSYSPQNFSGKGYKILRKNIKPVSLAVTKIVVSSVPTSDGYIAFIINGVESHVDVVASTDTTTDKVADKIATYLSVTMTEYEVSKGASTITLTRKFGGEVSTPSSFSAVNTGAVCTVIDSTKIEFRNLLTPIMINQPNTIYEIRYDFDLDGETIKMKEGCTLKFEGGKVCNGEIYGNNTSIKNSSNTEVLINIKFSGTWNVLESYPEWFGAMGDNITDDFEAFNSAKIISRTIRLNSRKYLIKKSLSLTYTNIVGEGEENTFIIYDGDNDFLTLHEHVAISNLSIKCSNKTIKGAAIKIVNYGKKYSSSEIYINHINIVSTNYSIENNSSAILFDLVSMENESTGIGVVYIRNINIKGWWTYGIKFMQNHKKPDEKLWMNRIVFHGVFMFKTTYGIFFGINKMYDGDRVVTHYPYDVEFSEIGVENDPVTKKVAVLEDVMGVSFFNLMPYDFYGVKQEYIDLIVNDPDYRKFEVKFIGLGENYNLDDILNTFAIKSNVSNLRLDTSSPYLKTQLLKMLCPVICNHNHTFMNNPMVIDDTAGATYNIGRDNVFNPVIFNNPIPEFSNSYVGGFDFNTNKRQSITKNIRTLFATDNDKSTVFITSYNNKDNFNKAQNLSCVYTTTFIPKMNDKINFKNGCFYLDEKDRLCEKKEDGDAVIATYNSKGELPEDVVEGYMAYNYNKHVVGVWHSNKTKYVYSRMFRTPVFCGMESDIPSFTKDDNYSDFDFGYMFFLRNTNIPIWWSGENWVTSEGVSYSKKKVGYKSDRPTDIPNGFTFYDSTLRKMIIWNSAKKEWLTSDGNPADAKNQGSSEDRPSNVNIGFIYKDTTLNKLILWEGSKWVNLDGTEL